MGDDELPLNPFPLPSDWEGRYLSWDGTSVHGYEFIVEEIIASSEQPGTSGWEGKVAAVCRLKDGRYISYETFWDVSGDGFRRDAYGGDADLIFSSTLEAAVKFGLTDEGRRMCGLPEDWNLSDWEEED